MHCIKDMRGEGRDREWLVAWAGEDDEGFPWEDSWQPTANVGIELRRKFLEDRKVSVKRALPIDCGPLDNLVRRELWERFKAEPAASFGHELTIPLQALTLVTLARYFLQHVSASYESTMNENAYVRELRIKVPESIGKFCAFENFSAKATQSMRFRGRRKTDVDASIVGLVTLRIHDNHPEEGCVKAEAVLQTAYINGSDGTIVGPHLRSGYLKKTESINTLITYAREIIPDDHPLVAKGWRDLPAHVYTVN